MNAPGTACRPTRVDMNSRRCSAVSLETPEGWRPAGVADHVGTEPSLQRPIDKIVDRRVRDSGNRLKQPFDLPGIDELASDPDSMIDAAEMHQTAVRVHPAKISGPVTTHALVAGFEPLAR